MHVRTGRLAGQAGSAAVVSSREGVVVFICGGTESETARRVPSYLDILSTHADRLPAGQAFCRNICRQAGPTGGFDGVHVLGRSGGDRASEKKKKKKRGLLF